MDTPEAKREPASEAEWIHALSLEWRLRVGGRPEVPPNPDQEQPLVEPQLAQR